MDFSSWIRRNGAIEAVLNTMVKTPGIKVFKGLEQRGITSRIIRWIVPVLCVGKVSSSSKDFGAEFSDVSDKD